MLSTRSFRTLIAFLLLGFFLLNSLQPYEKWWQQSIGSLNDHLFYIMQHINAKTRVVVRNYIQKKNYTTILDAGCGKGQEWQGFLQDKIPIYYQGVEVIPELVAAGQKQKINIVEGSIEQIPFEDQSFDLAYTRHVLEHLPTYQKALNELIRVARYEALIVFFIKPHQKNEDIINSVKINGISLYHNHYSKRKLQNFILSNSRVDHVVWHSPTYDEEILHIYLKNLANSP
jgi:ubiquinone/menaquinone biosynthesis C-methylase UbiE